LLDVFLKSALALGVVVYPPSMYMAFRGQVWGVAFMDTLVFVGAALLFVFKEISFEIRATVLTVFMYFLGVCLLIYVGPVSQIYLFAFSIVAAIFLGLRAALGAVALNGLTLLVLGYLSHANFRNSMFPLGEDFTEWAVLTLDFVLVNGAISLCFAVLLGGLEGALRKARATAVAMKEDQEQLLEANRRLEREMEERKRVEEDLHRLAMAVEQASEVIVVADVEGKPLYVNAAYETLTGLSRNEGLARGTQLLCEAGEKEDRQDIVCSLLAEDALGVRSLRIRRQDGGVCAVEATTSSIRDASGAPAGHVVVLRDTTQEAALEERLRESQKLEAIGTLAGGIAHDFNNILSSILGNAQSLSEDLSVTGPERECVEEIVIASKRARDLVRQILLFSRQLEVERKPVRVGDAIVETLRLLRPSIPSTVEIVSQIVAPSAMVMADPIQLHQVLMNLCTNAYQAMAEGGGVLTIQVDTFRADADAVSIQPRLYADREYVRMSVRDTGHGMDKAIQDRIFEPFFTTKEKDKGTGLGLATVHGIVLEADGDITVSSEPGHGTHICVFLPRMEAEFSEESAAPRRPTPMGNRERILVVDDEAALLRLARRFLDRFGYRPQTFSSSVEAVAAFRAAPENWDLVITDQTMPKLTGMQLAAELRRIRADIPIILVSGFRDVLAPEQLRDAGITTFLHKPYTREDFATTVHAALSQRKGAVSSGVD
jgi:PAS domain S-box-containing protein